MYGVNPVQRYYKKSKFARFGQRKINMLAEFKNLFRFAALGLGTEIAAIGYNR